MNEHAKQNAFFAGIAGLMMLGYAFGMGMSPRFDHGPVYAFSFNLFDWMLKIGGAALLIVAALCFSGRSIGMFLDAIVSKLCGIIMVGCAVCWTVYEGGLDLTNLLIGIFGVMFIKSAITNWRLYFSRAGTGEPIRRESERRWFSGAVLEPPKAQPPPGPRPIHPASLQSEVLPKDDEPPPPEGYLAALAKEKEDPPTAASD